MMKKYFLLLYLASTTSVYGVSTINNVLLLKCQTLGHLIFNSCIVVPPTTIEQTAYCTTIYLSYNSCLQLLNNPLPMIITREPSPFTWSPYDICRFEPANLAMFDLCPSTLLP